MEIAKLILEYLKVFIWPIILLSGFLIFRVPLCSLLNRLRKADFPGGVSLNFPEQLKEAEELSKNVASTPNPKMTNRTPGIPLTEANARMISLGLRPSPSGLDMSYYRELAEQDPNIALAGLRIEIEILAKNLAKGFGIEVKPNRSGAVLLKLLRDKNAITSEQMSLALKVWQLCSAAVHEKSISLSEANLVIDIANVLRDQYLDWLSWGFDDDWRPL